MYTGFPDLENPPDEVKVPHDGSGPGVAFAKIDDLGEVTANLVKEYLDAPGNFKYTNQVMLLSESSVWSLSDTVKLLGKVKKKEIRLKTVTEKEYIAEPQVQDMLGSHGPEEVPKQWATSFHAIKTRECAVARVSWEGHLGESLRGWRRP